MTGLERRNRPSDELAVENAIWLAEQAGEGAAIYYLHKKGIADAVAKRVLMGPQFRRHLERRTRSLAKSGLGEQASTSK